jgi:hypothetical protein
VSEKPPLRAVPDSEGESTPSPTPPTSRTETPRWIPIALAIALVITLALLVWSRSQLGGRISQLESEAESLRLELIARDRVISAHERRLDEVRAGLNGLRTLLDEPVE